MTVLRRWFHLLTLAALSLIASAPAYASPSLWAVKGPHSTVYLFGTVHMLPKDRPWRTQKIDAAMAASSALWLELSDANDTVAAQTLMKELGIDMAHPLSSKLSKEQFARLEDVARKAGLPRGEADIEPYQPWLAALSLSVIPVVQAGYDPKSGVELTIQPEFVKAGKAVHGFETMSQQFHFFADLPEQTEVAYLNVTVDDFDKGKARIDAMVEAWYAGDQAGIDKTMEGSFREESPDLYKRLLIDRNQSWIPKLTELIHGNETVFVAVGAGHLVGQDGVVALLRKAGFEVQQVQ